jgi:DNA-binding transcriptional MerR regulator
MRIGEVSRRSGVSVRMLRHYDSLGLVRPSGRTSAGYREYADEDLRRILHVEALRSLGLSLAQAGRALNGGEDAGDTATASDPDSSRDTHFAHDPAAVLDELIERTRERIAVEQDLLTRLEDARDHAPRDWDDVLATIALLRAVRSDDPGSRHALALAGESIPPAALARAALDEDETNIAGALRWAARRDPDGTEAVVTEAAAALSDTDPLRRRRAVALLADRWADAVADQREDTAAPNPMRSLLASACADEDAEVRVTAALALTTRPARLGAGLRETLTHTLLDLIVDGHNDVDAAEGLGRLAAEEAERTSAAGPDTSTPAGGGSQDSGPPATRAGGGRPPSSGPPASAVVVLLDRLRDPDVDAGGLLRLLQAAGELPPTQLRRVLDACADETDPDAARILTYLAHRLDGATHA